MHAAFCVQAQKNCSNKVQIALLGFLQSDTDTDSIGNVVCQRAEALAVVAVVMAGHSKSKVGDFFMGSVTNFCTHHCKKPVLVVH